MSFQVGIGSLGGTVFFQVGLCTPLQTMEFFVILGSFSPFYPPKNPKNQNFEKKKKTPGDIILHQCTKNHDHILYCSWYMVHDECNCYFSFWAIFCPFIPLTAQKIKIYKKNEKKHLEISFYTCVPKIMNRWCTFPEIWCATDRQIHRWMEKVTHRGWCPT